MAAALTDGLVSLDARVTSEIAVACHAGARLRAMGIAGGDADVDSSADVAEPLATGGDAAVDVAGGGASPMSTGAETAQRWFSSGCFDDLPDSEARYGNACNQERCRSNLNNPHSGSGHASRPECKPSTGSQK